VLAAGIALKIGARAGHTHLTLGSIREVKLHDVVAAIAPDNGVDQAGSVGFNRDTLLVVIASSLGARAGIKLLLETGRD
jgi:hypothetical protein